MAIAVLETRALCASTILAVGLNRGDTGMVED